MNKTFFAIILVFFVFTDCSRQTKDEPVTSGLEEAAETGETASDTGLKPLLAYDDVQAKIAELDESDLMTIHSNHLLILSHLSRAVPEIPVYSDYIGVFETYRDTPLVQAIIDQDLDAAFEAALEIYLAEPDNVLFGSLAKNLGDWANRMKEVAFYTAKLDYTEEDIEKIIQFMYEFVAAYPEESIPYILLGYYLDTNDALYYAIEAAKADPYFSYIYATLGYYLSQIDFPDYDFKIAFLNELYIYALARKSTCYPALYNLGYLNYAAEKDYTECLNWCWAAIDANPASRNAYELAGSAYDELYYSYEEIFDDIYSKADDESWIYYNWSKYYFENVIEFYQYVMSMPVMQIYDTEGNFTGHFQGWGPGGGIQTYDMNTYYYVWDYVDQMITNAYFISTDEMDKIYIGSHMIINMYEQDNGFAIYDILDSVENFETDLAGDLYFETANLYSAMGDYDKAIAMMNRVDGMFLYSYRPYQYYSNLGSYHSKNGDYEESIRNSLIAFDLNPKDSITLYNLVTTCFRLGMDDDTMYYFQLLTEADPDTDYSQLLEYIQSMDEETAGTEVSND